MTTDVVRLRSVPDAPTSAAGDAGADVVEITLLGGLRIERHGAAVDPPPGRPSALLRVVAAHRAVHADEVVEAVWPATPPGTGRRRLRNVLARLRAACGELVVREGDVLTLDEHVVVDVARFEADARRALSASQGDPTSIALAQRAISRYAGELLPEACYEDWSVPLRHRLRRLLVDLLDLLIADALQRDDVQRALRLLHRALDVEPDNEDRYLDLARVLLAHGRRGSAALMLRGAQTVATSLGLPPSPAYDELWHALAGPSPVAWTSAVRYGVGTRAT